MKDRLGFHWVERERKRLFRFMSLFLACIYIVFLNCVFSIFFALRVKICWQHIHNHYFYKPLNESLYHIPPTTHLRTFFMQSLLSLSLTMFNFHLGKYLIVGISVTLPGCFSFYVSLILSMKETCGSIICLELLTWR